ncbi:polynucleotide adenylyltransferase PcnB [Bowmanella sp. JS7-9]|uniref:Poly(A) polymerase I n=1 Tax=Pseudobowmanella zhangzhouensis TaxID=1537679 RepID=A0ABW1XRP0_9ALTE|nr:polynucleotide adenylyltransferase PcnB [Bowmanella sp. JS7-9]
MRGKSASPVISRRIFTREQHGISRNDIDDSALKVLYRLHNAGYEAYLVGGCVRDLMLGLHPKDFDVVTNATPEQVRKLFRNSRLIGRRFQLVHVIFGRDIIEVATFRGHHQDDENHGKQNDHGQILRDNVFGSIEEDAERRDFSVNAMYYNIADFTVHDFAGGVEALQARKLDLIGDPETRYREDPVRMLRAARFAAKLDMQIAERSAKPIRTLASLLSNIPPARLFEEVIKLFLSGHGERTLELMADYNLLQPLFPALTPLVKQRDSKEWAFLRQVMRNSDQRIADGLSVTPAFIYAALMWYPVEIRYGQLRAESGLSENDAFNLAMTEVIEQQIRRIMIPRRFTTPIREIWQMQQRLTRRQGRRAWQTFEHPRFRAGFDFLLVRGQAEGGQAEELTQWWQAFQEADNDARRAMLERQPTQAKKRPRRRRAPRPKKQES